MKTLHYLTFRWILIIFVSIVFVSVHLVINTSKVTEIYDLHLVPPALQSFRYDEYTEVFQSSLGFNRVREEIFYMIFFN